MFKRPLSLPINLAVIMLVLLVLLIVGWVFLFARPKGATPLFVTGLVFLGLVVAGVVVYMTLTIKAINLNRRQSNFIDSVTHELKSPIASLKLYVQTLKRRPVSPEEQAEFYQFMLDDVERLDLLINHILSAARLDKGSFAESAELIELSGLLRSCVDEVCARYRADPSTISLDLDECVVRGNLMDYGLIFRNLIDNAIKYADVENPECAVTSQYLPGHGSVVVRIRDNGQGIPGPLQRKIFGRFVRLGTELERKKPGTGLGLYIVRTLVKRWKGRVQVSSGERGGTVFQVTLPNATSRSTPQANRSWPSNSETSRLSKPDKPRTPTVPTEVDTEDTANHNPNLDDPSRQT